MRYSKIGLSCYGDRDKYYLYREYVSAIDAVNGIPIIIPHILDKDKLLKIVEVIDGLVLAGGGDIYPSFYGEKETGNLLHVNKERDEFELLLLEGTIKLSKPILGICRGCQLINVFLGGNLSNIDNHWQKAPYGKATQKISIREKTLLFEVIGKKEIMVNTFHHQAIKRLGNGLVVSAQAEDGIIEAVEKPGSIFLLGVQFHPEYLHENSEIRKIFDAFINAKT